VTEKSQLLSFLEIGKFALLRVGKGKVVTGGNSESVEEKRFIRGESKGTPVVREHNHKESSRLKLRGPKGGVCRILRRRGRGGLNDLQVFLTAKKGTGIRADRVIQHQEGRER